MHSLPSICRPDVHDSSRLPRNSARRVNRLTSHGIDWEKVRSARKVDHYVSRRPTASGRRPGQERTRGLTPTARPDKLCLSINEGTTSRRRTKTKESDPQICADEHRLRRKSSPLNLCESF